MAYEGFAYVYDRLMADMPYSEWVEFAQAYWARKGKKPERIVDLGCGTGSITLPLAAAGYQMTGIDLSETMLAIAREKAERTKELRPDAVLWLQQDMREWETTAPVDAVVSFCDCMNYLLEEEDVLASIRQTYAALKPGGTFLFDVLTVHEFQRYADNQPYVYNEEDVAYLWTVDWNQGSQVIEHDLTLFIQAGSGSMTYKRVQELHLERAYSLTWLKEALQACGFVEIECFADFTFASPQTDTSRCFLAAVKPS